MVVAELRTSLIEISSLPLMLASSSWMSPSLLILLPSMTFSSHRLLLLCLFPFATSTQPLPLSMVLGLSKGSSLLLLTVEVFTAAGLALGSIFMSTWRVGAYLSGSYVRDIDKNDDQVDDGRLPSGVAVGFPSRLYGLVYVVGNRRQSWLELAESTCDRWETFDASQPLFADAPPCVGKSTGVEKCTRDFNTHLADRCIMYKRMLMLSWCEYLIIATSTGIQILIGIALLTTSLLKYKHYYVVMLSFSGVLEWCGIVGYFIISWISFNRLAKTATFPYPTVSFAFLVNLLACVVLHRLTVQRLLHSSSD
ncbi:hypothetical protein FOZ60_005342 [Perkinsus olseni]|uniref:Uncharacterized protein n=1 Tax=Perkinsus olseni TaxID=32597 RepID=A0A7J6NR83_PEROL|nr:hypothetical protein FOZ60_005342 [Perkinsus olseni]